MATVSVREKKTKNWKMRMTNSGKSGMQQRRKVAVGMG